MSVWSRLELHRTITIQAGDHIITAEEPLPPNITTWFHAIKVHMVV